jgi:hypothetical protein
MILNSSFFLLHSSLDVDASLGDILKDIECIFEI